MRYGSVCSGIEAASQAWEPLGWEPQFFSEIEPFPCAVLAHHYGSNLPGKPVGNGVPNHGDMTKFKDWPDHAIELLVGGTPCQSFSIAGLRAGLADPRGNLMLTYLAIAAKYRPRWVAWENVPGVLSSNSGRDFGTFLRGLVELGYGVAYRVLDAQYVRVGRFTGAVPQRRRRVFVIGYLGDWRRAAAVLFDAASLRGDSAPRREAGQGIAPTISARTKGGGGLGTDFDCDGGLIAFDSKGTQVQTHIDGSSPPLRSMNNDQSHQNGGGQVAVAIPLLDGAKGRSSERGSRDGVAIGNDGDPMFALRAGGQHGVAIAIQGTVINRADNRNGDANASTSEADARALLRRVREALGEEAFAQWGLGVLDTLQSPEILRSALHGSELRPTQFPDGWMVDLARGSKEDRASGAMQSLRVAAGERRASHRPEFPEQRPEELGAYLSELSQPRAQPERFVRDLWEAAEGIGILRQALSALQKVGRPAGGEGKSEHTAWAVRRLTPVECMRLQGFPDDYFDSVIYRGKKPADGPIYKALGNSMAVNCMAWIGERIALIEAETMRAA